MSDDAPSRPDASTSGDPPNEAVERLVAAVRDEVGASLRAVVCGDFAAREYTAVLVDGALRETHLERLRDVCDDIALEGVATEHQTELSGSVGSLEVTTRLFEDGAALVAWSADDRPSVYVELGGDVDDLSPVVDHLQTYLRG